ncbi:diguanylate cyclase domain-containing protein [Undibacterium sp. Di27W]|uniref:diguanylate cyclase domain-containing protein n=1 Tax=Undibacterium sp. Di27W TaxID=3413036 RepID=UPI003BF1916C
MTENHDKSREPAFQTSPTSPTSHTSQTYPSSFSLPTFLGLALLALGLVVISGWLLQVRAMVEIRVGFVAMVFNTALCFTLTGLALALPGLRQKPYARLQSCIGFFLFSLCGLVLIEHLFDINLHVDWGFLHLWLQDGNIRPGRLAPNTAIGFMLTGLSLLLRNRINNRARELTYQILVFCILAIGLTGLVGYILSPDQLFGWARSARMAIHTALGMISIAIALWTNWHHANNVHAMKFFQLHEEIGFMSAAILCIATLTAGLTGFVFQQSILEDSLREKLQFQLDKQSKLIQSTLLQAQTSAERAANNVHLSRAAHQLTLQPDDAKVKTEIQAELQSMMNDGLHSADIISVDGKVLLHLGEQSDASNTRLALPHYPDHFAAIEWDKELTLYTDAPLTKGPLNFARLHLHQRLPLLQAQLFDLHGLGDTGEIALCAGMATTLICLPSGRQSHSYTVNKKNSAGQPLPMSFAIEGKAGLIATQDYKGNNVMAAFGPLSSNLGLVVKQDTTELYGAIRAQLKFVIPALLLILGLGVALMRSQIKPLAKRLADSENHAKERQLEMNTVFSSVGEGIMTINERGIVESFNDAAAMIFGYRAEEMIGQSLQKLMPIEMRKSHEAGMQHYMKTGESKVLGRPKLELPGLRKDGTQFTLELTVNEIKLDTRRIFVGVVRDITERKQFEEKLIFLAQYDVLTGLPNRALFMDRLSGAILRASRTRSALAVMFLDLDGFKNVNDTLGHHTGDELLKEFGHRLCMAVRKTDSVARLAGDEFTIILEGLNNPEDDTREVAEKIIQSMQDRFSLGEHQINITTSIGLAIQENGESDLDELLRRADDAMYRAKHSGKNRWSV